MTEHPTRSFRTASTCIAASRCTCRITPCRRAPTLIRIARCVRCCTTVPPGSPCDELATGRRDSKAAEAVWRAAVAAIRRVCIVRLGNSVRSLYAEEARRGLLRIDEAARAHAGRDVDGFAEDDRSERRACQ